MGKIVLFSDLDGTLFGKENAPIPATIDKNGLPGSFMSHEQRDIFNRFDIVVPVTGRSPEAFSRVMLPFSSWKILLHGLVILKPDNFPDEEWLEKNRKSMIAFSQSKSRNLSEFKNFCEGIKTIRVFGLDLCLIGSPKKDMPHKRLELEGDVIENAQKEMTVLPKGINKKKAVLHVMKKIPGATFIGMGDERSDLGFMRACDFAMLPKNNRIIGNAFLI